MTLLVCQPKAWTPIPDLAAVTIITATERGLLIDTSGALDIDDRNQGFQLPGGQSVALGAGTIARVTPANDLKATSVRYNKG